MYEVGRVNCSQCRFNRKNCLWNGQKRGAIGGVKAKGGRQGKSKKAVGVKSGGVQKSVGRTTRATAASKKGGEEFVVVEIPGGRMIRGADEVAEMQRSRDLGEGGSKEVGMGEVAAQPANVLDSFVAGPVNFGSYKAELTAMRGKEKPKEKRSEY
jgi:hypothetical protein